MLLFAVLDQLQERLADQAMQERLVPRALQEPQEQALLLVEQRLLAGQEE